MTHSVVPWQRQPTSISLLSQGTSLRMSGIRLLPNFTQDLLDRGYSADQDEAILGRNWFNHFKRTVG